MAGILWINIMQIQQQRQAFIQQYLVHTKYNFRCSIMTSWYNVTLIYSLISGTTKINNLDSTRLRHFLEIWIWWSRWNLLEKKKCQGLTKPHWVNWFKYINIHVKYEPMSETNCTTYLVKHCITGDQLVWIIQRKEQKFKQRMPGVQNDIYLVVRNFDIVWRNKEYVFRL
jgi:hypothetical protein